MSRKEDEDKEEYAVNGQVKNLHGHLHFFSDAKDWNVLDMVMFYQQLCFWLFSPTS
jgi:hypothetical protein